MTCIVGILDKENDCVFVGADSLGSNGFHKQLYKNKKVFKAKDNKNILMAVCGTFMLQNVLSIEDKLIEEIKELKNEVNFEHIVKYTSRRIVKLAKDYDFYEDKDQSIGGDIIFAYKNQLYKIQSGSSVLESMCGYVTGGSGGAFAEAVLSQNEDKPTVERIKEALMAAEIHAVGVQRPFYIMNTKDDEVVEIL
jgi:ATP-dependent protease HslVU (ClpYQ) peptidase subunit